MAYCAAMEAWHWLQGNWSELIQNVGIIAGLGFSAFTLWRDDRSRRISNLLVITQQYRDTWKTLYERPSLARVLSREVDLEGEPLSEEETLFVTLLVFHLDAAYQAMRAGMFAPLEGLKKDVREFFSLPIPSAVWETVKSLQNKQLVSFVESARK